MKGKALLQALTQVADYRGVRFVRDEKLRGRKYAKQYEGENEIYVSPAVYDLLASDLDLIASTLKVHILPPRRKHREE